MRTTPTSTAGTVRWLDSHPHAVALWHDGDTWASLEVRDETCDLTPAAAECNGWGRSHRRVRFSHGLGPIEERLDVDGVIGMRDQKVYAIVRGAGTSDTFVAIDARGGTTELGTVPTFDSAKLAITSTGEIAIAAATRKFPDASCSGDACDPYDAILIVGPSATRRYSLARSGEYIAGFAADRTSSRVAIALASKTAMRVIEIDPSTGNVVNNRTYDNIHLEDGMLVYARELWVRRDHALERVREGDAESHPIDDSSSLVMSEDGHRVAYERYTEGSDMWGGGPWCDIYDRRLDSTKQSEVYHTDGRCEMGFAIVGDTLWLSPP
jgi:hypothetical protein